MVLDEERSENIDKDKIVGKGCKRIEVNLI